ncbi:MAG: putative bifunctional diguanylate cyclase/phosphodiesterase, partial [Chloroflexota bacterium]
LVLPPSDSTGAGTHHPPEMVIGEQRQGEGLVLTKDGRELTVLTNSVVFIGDDSRIHCAFFVFDITERKQYENNLTHAAHHDALTGLPNRVLYHDRLGQALLAAQRQGYALSILMIDLNGFKLVNDTLGHDAGDRLLREVALRLQAVVRAGDTVARLGGDEFGVVLPQSDEAGATRVANKIRVALAPAVLIEGREVFVGGSVGIAVFGEHGDDAESLQKAADLAMYAAKDDGGGYAVYSPSLGGEPPAAKEPREGHEPRERRRSSISAELRQAITRGDLRLHYQPLVSCTDGGVRRVEALVRWQHPEQGLLPPAYFIAAAEQSGAITPLTIWVLEEALRQYQVGRRQGLDLGIAVNVSLRTLRESQFPDLVVALLREYGISPGDLTLEITENSILEEQEQTLAALRTLAELGVRIALDDVGIGHSSLEYITQLPVHELKVDRSFLSAAPGSKGHAVVCCILGLGAALNLSVVVEGVETQEAWD